MGDPGKAIAKTLRDQGWEQGAVLDFDYHTFAFDPRNPAGRIAVGALNRWNQEATKRARSEGQGMEVPLGLVADYGTLRHPSDVRDRVIVVSQTCDILADADDEPWVEVLRLHRAKPEFLELLSHGNSARVFCVDPDARLVVQAPHRTRLDKGVLMARNAPVTILPHDESRREQFRRWLGRRFTRPALPDDLDTGFRRVLEDRLRETDPDGIPYAAIYSACSEIRHRLVGTAAPYRVDLLFITEEPPERELEARIDDFVASLCSRIDRKVVSALSGIVMRLSDIRAADYLATQPFLLEHFTTTDFSEGGAAHGVAAPPSDRL